MTDYFMQSKDFEALGYITVCQTGRAFCYRIVR